MSAMTDLLMLGVVVGGAAFAYYYILPQLQQQAGAQPQQQQQIDPDKLDYSDFFDIAKRLEDLKSQSQSQIRAPSLSLPKVSPSRTSTVPAPRLTALDIPYALKQAIPSIIPARPVYQPPNPVTARFPGSVPVFQTTKGPIVIPSIPGSCSERRPLANCACNCRRCQWKGPVGSHGQSATNTVPNSNGQDSQSCATARQGFITRFNQCDMITSPGVCRTRNGGIVNTGLDRIIL